MTGLPNGASGQEGGATSLEEGVVALVPDRLYALPGPYELDGRVATHPRSAQGYGSMNCYLLVEGDRAMLLDAGMSVHEELLIRQLESLLEPGMELTVCPTRLGEFNAICNVRPVVERFGVRKFYANLAHAETWVDFRPEYTPYGTAVGGGALAEVSTQVVRRGTSFDFSSGGNRPLTMIQAPLRLLPAFWTYDEATRTLFTSDSFTYAWSDAPEGPWVIEEGDDDPSTPESIRDYLIGSRYWWLAGSDTDRLRAEIDAVFEGLEVERLAPGFGRVFSGRETVARQRQLLDGVLETLGKEPSIGLETGHWSLLGGNN